MPKFEVTIIEKRDRSLVKTFTAKDTNEAKEQAEADVWTEENGWERADPDGGLCEAYIDNVEKI
jgi:hypothetical protein